jgi:hypothetical protein
MNTQLCYSEQLNNKAKLEEEKLEKDKKEINGDMDEEDEQEMVIIKII